MIIERFDDLAMQVAVFDLELQAPAASTKLPAGRPAFRAVLGAFGHASAGGSLLTSGLDAMHCLHQVRSRQGLVFKKCNRGHGSGFEAVVPAGGSLLTSGLDVVCGLHQITILLVGGIA